MSQMTSRGWVITGATARSGRAVAEAAPAGDVTAPAATAAELIVVSVRDGLVDDGDIRPDTVPD